MDYLRQARDFMMAPADPRYAARNRLFLFGAAAIFLEAQRLRHWPIVYQKEKVPDRSGGGKVLAKSIATRHNRKERLGFLQDNNINVVVLNGDTYSLDDPSFTSQAVSKTVNQVVDQLMMIDSSIKQGIIPPNVEGYMGEKISKDYLPSFENASINCDTNEKGDTIIQVRTLQKKGPWIAIPGLDIFGAKRSMLVAFKDKQSDGPKFAWFDNVDSGKNTIEVDTKNGAVYQIFENPSNLVSRLVGNIKASLTVQKVDFNSNRFVLQHLASSPQYITDIVNVIIQISNQYDKEIPEIRTFILEKIYSYLFSPDATAETKSNFIDLINQEYFNKYNKNGPLSLTAEQKQIIDSGTLSFVPEIPVSLKRAVDLVGAIRLLFEGNNAAGGVREIIEMMDNGVVGGRNASALLSTALPGDITKAEALVKNIADQRIRLPQNIPQLLILRLVKRDITGTVIDTKQVLTARYSSYDMKEMVGGPSTAVLPGETILFINDSKIDDPTAPFDNAFKDIRDRNFSQRFRQVSGRRTKLDLKTWENGRYTDGWEIDESTGYESMSGQVDMFYDPALTSNNLFAGMIIEGKAKNGKPLTTVIELKPKAFGTFYSSRIVSKGTYANRPVPIFGDYPSAVLKVTDQVKKAIAKGIFEVSRFGFMEPMEAAEMIIGLGSPVDYTNLAGFLGTNNTQLPTLKQKQTLGELIEGPHSMVIVSEDALCKRYTIEKSFWREDKYISQSKIEDQPNSGEIKANMVLAARKIININGIDQVVIAEGKEIIDGLTIETVYTVPLNSVMFAGVETDFELFVLRAAELGAVVFGGVKLFANPTVRNLTKLLFKALTRS